MKGFKFAVLAAVVILMAATSFAQTTSTIVGTVTSEGMPLPGATVTISSPNLQGTRTTVTNESGAYIFQAVPPGTYTVTVELEGLQSVTRQQNVALAQQARVDADLRPSALTEAITVTAAAPAVLETTEVATNFEQEMIENLPTGRTVTAITDLAPGVSGEGPNNQLMISGAPSYENLYLVNGAVVNDSIRGQPEAVYIEDALEETTVLTGMVSAEYGRFTGGVINAITKSGGNEFSGSLRDTLTNDSWTNKTDYAGQAEPKDELNETYEATLGGRIIRDRLWFFGAGRMRDLEETRTTLGTNVGFDYSEEETRWEGKLTGQITPRHSVVGSYLDRETTQTNYGSFAYVDTRSLSDRELPNSIAVFNYNGILTDSFLVEAKWSEREFAFVGGGAMTRDRIEGTIIRDNATARRGWSPTFCGICDPKTRDNEYWSVKGSYFLSTPGVGNHNIVGGYEDFSELRTENNEQGGSGYRVWGDFIYRGQDVYFTVTPGTSTIENWPVLQESLTSDSKTRSLFVNDKWDFTDHWSFNVGLRYDENDAVDQAGNKTSDDSGFSPRLSAMYDMNGDGRHRISAGYNVYVSKIDNGVNDSASTAGSPAYFGYLYEGPALNPPGTPDSELLTTDEVLRRVFAWFDSVGGDNAPLLDASLPGVNVQLLGSLDSPKMEEYSVGYGTQLGSRGVIRADYIFREWSDFYASSTNLSNGIVEDALGNKFDLTYVTNENGGLEREYNAVMLQGSYRILNRLNFGGNYTWAELEGNADSETSNNATITLAADNHFPEFIERRWNSPVGYLNGDVRHRANAWLTYDIPTGIGNFNLSLLQRFHSGYAYSAVGTVRLRGVRSANLPNPGYISAPTTASYYFSERGAFRTDDVTQTDIGLNYSLPIGPASLFIQGDVLNIFDEQNIEDPNGISQVVRTTQQTSALQPFNPFTETPVEGVHYQFADNFGQATSAAAYQLPLTYRVSVGVRF